MIAPMLAPLATLAFLATLWLLVVVGVAVLEESGARIGAALKGKPVRQRSLSLTPVRVRARLRMQPMRATAQWRAAA
jgi:hypothetical protein